CRGRSGGSVRQSVASSEPSYHNPALYPSPARGGGQGGGLYYRGGNCEFGAGVTRLAVGARSVNPITAQLISMPTVPYGAPPGPVIKSGRVAARLKTAFSSIWRLSRP